MIVLRWLFSRGHVTQWATFWSVRRSVNPSVHQSVTFVHFPSFLPCRSCQSAWVAPPPAQPCATKVAAYPALFFNGYLSLKMPIWNIEIQWFFFMYSFQINDFGIWYNTNIDKMHAEAFLVDVFWWISLMDCDEFVWPKVLIHLLIGEELREISRFATRYSLFSLFVL